MNSHEVLAKSIINVCQACKSLDIGVALEIENLCKSCPVKAIENTCLGLLEGQYDSN